jgi:uncharacterized protein (TIRG00374 family)
MANANLYWLTLGVLISLVSHWLRALRATQLYSAMQYEVSVTHSFYAVLVGYMMNYIIPIPRAGEVSRCASLSKTDDVPVEKSLGSVVTERLVDMVLLLLILSGTFIFQFDLISKFLIEAKNSIISKFTSLLNLNNENLFLMKITLIIFLALTIIVIVKYRRKISQSKLFLRVFDLVQGFGDGLLSIRHLKNPFLFIILSVLIWVGYILMMYFCLFSMESTAHLNLLDCLTVFAIGTIGIVIPAPGGGAGSYHLAVASTLLLYGVNWEDGIAYATMVHALQMIVILVLGSIASLLVFSKQKKKLNE